MVARNMRVELSGVFHIYLRPPFVYHQSIMVPVKVNIDILVEGSQLNTFIRPFFSKREFNSLVDDFENGRKL